MVKPSLIRKCVTTGTIFGISHFIFGIFVYLLIIGISTFSTLTILCSLIFILIGIVFFIIGCQQFCFLNENQSQYLISSATSSLFASISCFFVNTKWLGSANLINSIPFYLIIIASLFLTFTSTLVALIKFLKFNNVFPLFNKRGTILGKFACDLITSLILTILHGLTYSKNDTGSKTILAVFILFGAIPCSLYTTVGCFLECYAQKAEDIADSLTQI